METQGDAWLEALSLTEWPVPAVVDFLTLRPFGPETWGRARHLGPTVWARYWQKAGAFVYGLQTVEIEQAAREFLAHGRPFIAMDVLASAHSQQSQPS